MDFKRILALILISLSFSASNAGVEYIAPNEDILTGTIYLLSSTQNNKNDKSINNSIEALQQAHISEKIIPIIPNNILPYIEVNGKFLPYIEAVPLKNTTIKNLDQILKIGIKGQDIDNWCTTDNKLFSENEKFPEYWPLYILNNLKEDDVFYIKIYGKVVKLTAKQKNAGSVFNFQQAITFLKTKLKLHKSEHGAHAIEEYPNKSESNQEQTKSTNKYKTYFKNTFYYAIGLCAASAIVYYRIIPELQRTYEDFCGMFKTSLSHLFGKK